MLAKLVPEIPAGALYEPKFDGFRCIVFRDGGKVTLGSRNERPLDRYFPEIVDAVLAEMPERCVVDGEIVLMRDGRLDFEALQQRIHPAASRVKMLARETPAAFVAFDLIALGDVSLVDRPFSERRRALSESFAGARPPVYVTPITDSLELAREWFFSLEGAGADGVVAKPPDIRYVPDRRVMFKIKHERTADCVVAGFRWHRGGDGVGSLMLGLYFEGNEFWPVGVCASFAAATRTRLAGELQTLRLKPGESHPWSPDGATERLPGEPSRWSQGKDQSWEPLRPERVVEVSYDYMEGHRFRHVTHFRRWRPDREAASCTFDQLERPADFDLRTLLDRRT